MKFAAQKKRKAKPAPVVSTHTACPCGGDHSRAKRRADEEAQIKVSGERRDIFLIR